MDHFKNKGVVNHGIIQNGDEYKSPEIQKLICKNVLPEAEELCRTRVSTSKQDQHDLWASILDNYT